MDYCEACLNTGFLGIEDEESVSRDTDYDDFCNCPEGLEWEAFFNETA